MRSGVRRSSWSVNAQAAAFGAGQLHQAFRKAGQPLERRLDLGGPGGGRRVCRLATQPLGLGDGAGQRRAQFMRGIGGKAALRLEGRLEPGQDIVERCRQRSDLGGKIACRNGRQIARAARREACAEAAQRREARPHGQHDRSKCNGDHHQQRQAEAKLDLARDTEARWASGSATEMRMLPCSASSL